MKTLCIDVKDVKIYIKRIYKEAINKAKLILESRRMDKNLIKFNQRVFDMYFSKI